MSKNVKKILLGLSAGVGLITFGISGVDAGQLMKKGEGENTLVPFSSYPAIQNSYKVGYEIYQPGVTVTSTQKTVIAISFNENEISNGTVEAPFTVTFTFPDNNAEFAIAGSNYIWVLTDDPKSVHTIYAASEPGANGPSISLSSGKLLNPQPLKAGTYYLMQVQWTDNSIFSNGLIDSYDTFGKPTNPAVNLKNIQATCSGSAPWKLTASISGSNGNIAFPQVSFAYVTPQYSFSQIVPPDFTAELDADNGFKTFVPSTNISNISSTTLNSTLTIQITDNANVDTYNWIAWSSGAIFDIKFALSSLNPEPGVKSITIDGVNCTTADNSTWNCESPNISGSNNSYNITLTLDENTTNNPTEWFLQNLTITSTTLSSLCNVSTYAKQSIGVWWGGVEAIVPFVKSDPNSGAQTYIVLYNRRDKDADVYATALLKNSGTLVVPKTKIGTIPAQGSIRFTADDLKRLLPELSDYDMSKGVPIKFLVYVPSAYREKGIDPYVEGIVVSVYGNAQRSVPLKFRQARHGDYNE